MDINIDTKDIKTYEYTNLSSIVIGIRFYLGNIVMGQLYIEFISDNKYRVIANGTFSDINETENYKRLQCFFNVVSLKKFIIDKLKKKYENYDSNIINKVSFFFIDTKQDYYKKINIDITNDINNQEIHDNCRIEYIDDNGRTIELESDNISKIDYYDKENDIFIEEDINLFYSRVIDTLDKYLELQPKNCIEKSSEQEYPISLCINFCDHDVDLRLFIDFIFKNRYKITINGTFSSLYEYNDIKEYEYKKLVGVFDIVSLKKFIENKGIFLDVYDIHMFFVNTKKYGHKEIINKIPKNIHLETSGIYRQREISTKISLQEEIKKFYSDFMDMLDKYLDFLPDITM